MRHNIIKKISLFLLLAVMISSCKKWIDTDLNTNPNRPADVTMALLLPSTQSALGYVIGGDYTRVSAMWMQHLSGVDRQSLALERYSVLESDQNNLWNTLYGEVLKNLSILQAKAEEQNAMHFLGISKVMTAYTLAMITDVWGDAPFTEALNGDEGNLTPVYDSQESIYGAVNTLLTEAIAHLGETTPTGVPVPGTSDLIFGGDAAKWMAVAKTLKVRYTLHLSKKNGLGPVRDAINAGGLIADNDGDFQFNFGVAANENNPRFQFDDQRGDIRVGAKIVDLMNVTGDPRIAGYFDKKDAADYTGSTPGGAELGAAWAGPAYAGNGAPVFFLNYFEVKFMEAEAFFGTDNARAATAYNDAVKASLAKHGVSDAAWEAVNAAETSGSISLEKIMTGKYIANYLNSETWVDWKRTAIPSLSLPASNVSVTPRRYLYPTDERLYNGANMPAGVQSTDRVWWDQ
ncbi:MAG: hypothetical protein CVT92_05720 [Bacteroidetes bacterium HGW-Bacteroidetes-1]|jgi:hypothetical protein|nr:MAG: hypothetical protein CVT92_05720 [Bacteroidetes bacterium HGW-Bacteroidetes-1]